MSEIKLKPPTFIKVNDIAAGKHCYNVIVKVIKVNESERVSSKGEKVKVVEGTVADETASAEFKFVGEHAKNIAVGNVIAIRNGRSSVINEHIVLELDKFGKVSIENDKTIDTPKTDFNISDVKWEKKVHARSK